MGPTVAGRGGGTYLGNRNSQASVSATSAPTDDTARIVRTRPLTTPLRASTGVSSRSMGPPFAMFSGTWRERRITARVAPPLPGTGPSPRRYPVEARRSQAMLYLALLFLVIALPPAASAFAGVP